MEKFWSQWDVEETGETDIRAQGQSPAALLQRLMRENRELHRQVAELRVLQELAYRDSLTGLRNRRYFDERFVEEVARLERNPRCFGAVLVIDVNDFKEINDKHGHAAGDETLKWLGARLERTVRMQDVCCRTGGDEFFVIMPDTNLEGAKRVAQRVKLDLRNSREGVTHPATVAIGAAQWPGDGQTVDELLKKADRRMYQDKAMSKDPGGPPADKPLRLVS